MTRGQIAEKLGVSLRWLPSAEHAGKIAEWIERGRCHIAHRGHGNAPLLIFEDGGSMEVPSVRWANINGDFNLISISETHSNDKTTHYDVCGTIDTIKEAIADAPELGGLQELLNDVEHMILRMNSRRDEYERFVDGIQNLLGRKIRRKAVHPASAHLSELRQVFSMDAETVKSRHDYIVDKAEAVRDVAQFLEYSLEDYREMVLEIERVCREIRGARSWPRSE